MKNTTSSLILIIVGVLLFISFGGLYSDFGIIGTVCFISGVLGLFFPKINENFLKIKSKNNLSAVVSFFIILVLSLIYIWYKS